MLIWFLVISFSDKQIEKLSDLFMDLAKGLFLAAFAVPALTTGADFLFLLRIIISGIMCTYFSLWLIGLRGVQI